MSDLLPKPARYPYELEHGTYDRNRRYDVEKDTKFVLCTVTFHTNSSPRAAAAVANRTALMEAIRLWGRLNYDQMQVVTTYLTNKVLVELRIWPR